MSSTPKITILMPIYNKEQYIAEAIESVLMQEMNYNFQLIIIDDKSVDKGLEIARKYQSKHPKKIRIITNEKNEGCLAATLKGYEQTKTEYFCVLDPDDYWIDKNKLQKAIDFLDTHSDFTMYVSNTYIKDIPRSCHRAYDWSNSSINMAKNFQFKMSKTNPSNGASEYMAIA